MRFREIRYAYIDTVFPDWFFFCYYKNWTWRERQDWLKMSTMGGEIQ